MFAAFVLAPDARSQTVVDPYFEHGLVGWKFHASDVIGPPRFPASGRFGTHMAAIGVGDEPNGYLQQTIAFPSGMARVSRDFVLLFDFGSIGVPGSTAVLKVEISDNRGRSLLKRTLVNQRPQPDYRIPANEITSERLFFYAPLETTWITVRFSDESPNGGYQVDPAIDNVAVVPLTDLLPGKK